MKFLASLTAVMSCLTFTASAQMHSGSQMLDFDKVFGVQTNARSSSFDVTLIDSQPAGNVLYPGEQPTFTFLVKNNGTAPIAGSGKIDVVSYGTRGTASDIWIPQVVKFADLLSVPIEVNIPPQSSQVIEVKPTLPETFGGYGLIVDLGTRGRRFATSCVRTFAQPEEEKIQFPRMALDATVRAIVLKRIGIHAVRFGISYIPSQDPHYEEKMAALEAHMREFSDNNITVLGTMDTSSGPQPLGRGRPHPEDDGLMQKTKEDLASLPESDPDFQGFVTTVCQQWPSGGQTGWR
jgi:hypothetical protein